MAIAIATLLSPSLSLFPLSDSDTLASLKMGTVPIQNLAIATSLSLLLSPLLSGNSPIDNNTTLYLAASLSRSLSLNGNGP